MKITKAEEEKREQRINEQNKYFVVIRKRNKPKKDKR